MSATITRNETNLEFSGKHYAVKKMNLGQYAKFSAKLEELLPGKGDIQALLEGATADRIKIVMDLLKKTPLRFAELIHVATNIPLDDLLEATPDEILDLAEQVYGLNEISRLGDRIKKALSLGMAQAQAPLQK